MEDIISDLKKIFKGEISTDPEVLTKHSRDESVFQVMPQLVVFPQDLEDIQNLIKFVSEKKQTHPELSMTPRSGGTCMSGGTLTDSISVDMKNFNKIIEIGNDFGLVEPGTYYRDFEKETLAKNVILPSYTSSKLICTVGGMVANNAGGEKSLNFGKTEKYIAELQMVLRDGKEYTVKKLTKEELDQKIKQQDIEGEIYQKMFALLDKNYDVIKEKTPKVSKNSSGYTIWKIWDKESQTFDLSQVFIGAQGTLGINTKIKFKLVPIKKEDGLLVVYLKDFQNIPEIIKTVLKYKPTSFESFDDYTLNLALKYVFDFAPILHEDKLHTALEFMPEFMMKFEGRTPKLSLLVEFEDDTREPIDKNIIDLQEELKPFTNVHTKVAHSKAEREKDWAIRRQSFNLLKSKLTNLKACPFVDDTCIDPQRMPEFLPRLYKILDGHNLLYSIAGHIGNGNFHIFPLLDLTKEEEREKIFSVGKEVFDLVFEFGGSTSGEHNDGFVRSPYLKQQFGEEIYTIFKEVKQIFDPKGIFNPHKKIGVTNDYIKPFLLHTVKASQIDHTG